MKVHEKWSKFQRAEVPKLSKKETKRKIQIVAKDLGKPFAEVKKAFEVNDEEEIWLNSRYQVIIREETDFSHLSIKRHDKEPIHDWRDLQRIKNELVGPECEGIELYPAESRLLDTANQFHLWVRKNPNERLPYGFDCSRTVANYVSPESGAKQRAYED